MVQQRGGSKETIQALAVLKRQAEKSPDQCD